MPALPQLSVILCAQPRSGSYLLCDLLGDVGIVPRPDEWLTDLSRAALSREFGLAPELDRIAFIEELVRRKTGPNGIFAVKVMGWNFWPLIWALEKTERFAGQTHRAIVETLFPHPRYVSVRRRDHVRQAVSFARAHQTDCWHKRTGADAADRPLVYSLALLRRLHRAIRESEVGWDYFFAVGKIEPYEIIYEDLVADPAGVLQGLHTWLGRETGTLGPEVIDRVREGPQSDDLNARWARRYEADLAALAAARADGSPPVPLPPESLQLELATATQALSTDRAEVVRATVTHTGTDPWTGGDPTSDADEGWVFVRGELPDQTGPGGPYLLQELPAPFAPGDSVELELFLAPPRTPGTRTVALEVGQICAGAWKPLSNPVTLTLESRFPPSRAGAQAAFPDLEVLPDDQCYVAGFGYFFDLHFPWIYHSEHEWLKVDPAQSDATTVRIFDAILGWITFPRATPQHWTRVADGTPLTFLRRERDRRVFRNPLSGTEETHPTNTPAAIEAARLTTVH